MYENDNELLENELYELLKNKLIAHFNTIQQDTENKMERAKNDNVQMSPDDVVWYFKISNMFKSAIYGDVEAAFKLAHYFLNGYGVPKDEIMAFLLFRFLAERGIAAANIMLGRCYHGGIGTPRNIPKAIQCFEQSSDNNVPDVLAYLGSLYYDGNYVTQDKKKAAEYFVAAADAGHRDFFRFYSFAAEEGNAHALYMLGRIYEDNQYVPQNIPQALSYFHQAAEQGDPQAQCNLGIIHLKGLYNVEQDMPIAVQWLRLAAAQGEKTAMKYLGDCLIYGENIEKNENEAILILQQLAQESSREKPDRTGLEHIPGDKDAQYMLGRFFLDKTRSQYNPTEGIKCLRKSAQQGYSLAQTQLGLCLMNGDDVKQNINEARKLFHQAAKQDDPIAQYYLAEIYAEGKGIPANRKEAFKWYKKSADLGYVPAQQIIADWYLNGKGVAKNETAGYSMLASLALWGDQEAFTLLRSAAISGNAVAQCLLARYFLEKNENELAISWLQKAVEQNLASAQSQMGAIYQYEGNQEKANHYFQLAAEQGDAEAQVALALEYENGINREKDTEKGFYWMKKAADQGHIQANYYLGNLYRDGTGTLKDRVKAFECYKKAAAGGSSDGIDRLGCCYRDGSGVEQDISLSFQLFQEAVRLGNPKGQCNLGIAFLQGIGCEQNQEIAFQWIGLAASSGHPAVHQYLESIGLNIPKLADGYQQFQQQIPPMHEKRFGKTLDSVFQEPYNIITQTIPPNQSPPASPPVANNKYIETLMSNIQEIPVWSNDEKYTGLPENINVWYLNFYVKNKDYYTLADIAERKNISINQVLEKCFFSSNSNLFLDHFGGRFPKRLTPDPVWIAAIVIGTEQDMQLTFAKIVGYIEQSGAAKGYEDLEYLMPYSNQRYIGWGESLNKETKYRYKFIDDKLQQFKIPEKSE